MNVNKFTMAIVIELIVCRSLVYAQEIVTDRPGQSNTPKLISKGIFQIETGFLLQEDQANGDRTVNYTYNTSLLKFGFNNNFEARVNLSYLGLQRYAYSTPISSGLGPVALGVKIKIADEKGLWPQAAVMCNVNVNTGSREFNSHYTAADITFAFSHTLSKRVALTYNTGIKWDGEHPEAIWLYTLSLGYTITKKLGMFAETYSFLPENHKPDNRADAGFTYKVSSSIQCDISGGLGLTTYSPDYFVSTGWSFQF